MSFPMPNYWFVFDVESIGLHGEAFAFGFVVLGPDLKEVDSGQCWCHPDFAVGSESDRRWVRKNIDLTAMAANGSHLMNTYAVRQVFRGKWGKWKSKGAALIADCSWPVEARFLAQTFTDPLVDPSDGPYPLHDLATAMLWSGLDPLATYDREPDELPAHTPLADARQSSRILLGCLLTRMQP